MVVVDTAGMKRVESRPDGANRSRWLAVALFAFLALAYFAIGSVLNLRYNVFDGDGLSRVANTGYVLMSRNPHLSAIGFVWNPLPSLAEIPLLPLSQWWPELKTHGLAGSAQSALFMAGSALLIRQIGIDRGVGVFWRWTAVACFSLHPVIILIGGFGLSEAATIFCVLWCVRHLLRWVTTFQTGDLAWAGISLGFGYLSRYEVLATVLGVAALVGVTSYLRESPLMRWHFTFVNLMIVVFPSMVAFVVWALASWVVTGEMFATLTSVYGNASQVSTAHERGGETSFTTGNWRLIAALMLAMQPFTAIAIAWAAVSATIAKRVDTLVPVAAFGSMLAFILWGQFSGTTFNLFRYYLPALPMVLTVALASWSPTVRRATWWRTESFAAKVGALLLCLSMVVGLPVTTRALFSNELGIHQQLAGLTSLFDERRHKDAATYRQVGNDDRLLAAYLDRKHLPGGSVLMDTFTSWLIWLASDNPKQFVVTSDYDFTAALNRPWEFGIQYIVVSTPGSSATNAIQIRYPSMWFDGAGIGELVYSVAGESGDERWRIYRIVKPAGANDKQASLTQPP